MLRTKILPVVYVLFAILSLLILKSVAPALVSTQLLFFVAGGVLFWLASQIDYQRLENWGWLLYAGLLASLAFVFLLGNITRGSSRWFSAFGLFNIQPSQLAIPIVLVMTIKLVLTKKKITLARVFTFLVLLGLPSLLILIEPDLGTTLVLLGALGSVLWLSPVSWKTLLSLVGGSIAVAVFAWFLVLHDYQKQRLTSFLFASQDSSSNYNAYQALVAVGSGKIIGRGLGQGIQSQLKFLPEKHTDFIFAALGEETGFLGSIFVVGLYTLLVLIMGFVGEHAATARERYFCWGVASMVAIQATVNIGMNIGLLPITGVTLPLISYGGSSILTTSVMYGLVQGVATREHKTAVLKIT